ncbi:thiol-disulfide isomerase/thioredoxin [Streptacidiphilus sp. MAP12-20]|uniref:TlpA family protein disulfide reductase n=1 Tax=Streptacidiphilus sp. MAP12-20 TaxID=3156299 RepID=UPI003517E02D
MADPTGLIVCAAVLVAATVFGLIRAARDGKLRPRRPRDDASRLSATDLGEPLGTRATLVQFSTSFCATCPATRRLLRELAAATPGVTHVDIDATVRLDLVRQFDVLRTPTVLVLNPTGHLIRRASGPPTRTELLAALEEAATA